jgi:uncharacterized protein
VGGEAVAAQRGARILPGARIACVPAETRVEVENVLIDGEDAVVFGTYQRMFAKNARSFDTPEAMHIRVVDGRIVRWHLYGDTGRVEDAWLDR